MQTKPPTDLITLEKNIAKNNAKILKAVNIGIKMLNTGTRGGDSAELKKALEEIADSICTKPPGCDPDPVSDPTN